MLQIIKDELQFHVFRGELNKSSGREGNINGEDAESKAGFILIFLYIDHVSVIYISECKTKALCPIMEDVDAEVPLRFLFPVTLADHECFIRLLFISVFSRVDKTF